MFDFCSPSFYFPQMRSNFAIFFLLFFFFRQQCRNFPFKIYEMYWGNTEYWIHFKWAPPSCSFPEFMWQKSNRHETNWAEIVDTQSVDEILSMEYLHEIRNVLILFEPNVDFKMTNQIHSWLIHQNPHCDLHLT